MAKSTPAISDTEWLVMQVLWDRSPLTANEVVDALAVKHARKTWHPRTVKTMLNRLITKGALGFTTEGKRYLYRPAVTRAACVRQESQSFTNRVFEGATAPMISYLVKQSRLSAEELDQLKRILDDKGK